MFSLSDFNDLEVDVNVGLVPFDEPGVFKCKLKSFLFKGAHRRGTDEFEIGYNVELEESEVAQGRTSKRTVVFGRRLVSGATEGQKRYFKHSFYMLLASMAGNNEQVNSVLSKLTNQNLAIALQEAIGLLNILGKDFYLKIVRKKTKQGQLYFDMPNIGFETRRPFLSKDSTIVEYIAELDDNLESYTGDNNSSESSNSPEESTQDDDLPFDGYDGDLNDDDE